MDFSTSERDRRVKFRIQVVAAILFFGGNLGLAGQKGPLTSQTDFKAMPPEQVLLALKNAEKIEAMIPKNEGKGNLSLQATQAACRFK
jgi:hypothetical protein